MAAKDGPRGVDALNVMGFRLGEVAKGLKEAAEKIAEASGRDGVKTSVDVRIRGLDEVIGERGGGVSPGSQPVREGAPAQAEAREPLVDTFDEADAYVVTVELPGVAEAEIAVTIENGRVLIETLGARRYRAQTALPEGVAVSPERRLANGILELRFLKA